MTGKRNDSTAAQSKELSAAERARLESELAYHADAAASIQRQSGQKDTYHHQRAAELRAALDTPEVDNGKLD